MRKSLSAEQPNSRTAEQPNSRTAEQPNSHKRILTRGQRCLLREADLAQDLSNKGLAPIMGVSTHAIRMMFHRMFITTDFHNRGLLLRAAIKNGWLDD